MKEYIKPTLEVENIVIKSSIMSVSDAKGEYSDQPLKVKVFDFEVDDLDDVEF